MLSNGTAKSSKTSCVWVRCANPLLTAHGGGAKAVEAGEACFSAELRSRSFPRSNEKTSISAAPRRAQSFLTWLPWQRARLQAAGGVCPLVFGQYGGEFGSGLQTLLDELALAGAAEAAERYLLESSVAAAAVQKRLLRQRLVCCVAQAQADVLLSRALGSSAGGCAGGPVGEVQ